MRQERLASSVAPALAAMALGACYSPQLADCTVRCSTGDDCGPGQACTAQGYCAAPDRACATSSSDGPFDAAMPPEPDAHKMPDGRPMRLAQLHVTVTAGGKVRVGDAGTCEGNGPEAGDCSYGVIEAAPVTLKATPRGGYDFERWTSTACAAAGETCVLTPLAPLTEVAAKFVSSH